MAVTLSGGDSANGSTTNFEFSTTGFDDGDLIIMGVSVAGDVSGSVAPDEAGWTSLISQVYETGSEGTLYIWYRVLSGSPPSTYGVTWSGSVNSAGFCVALAGQDSTPIDFASTYNEANSTSPVNTAGTTTVDNVFLLEVLGLNRNDRVTPPTGTTPTWTEQVDRGNGTVGGGTSIAVYTGTLASAGGTGTHTIGGVGAAAAWGVALIGVRPSASVDGNASPATVNAVAAVPTATVSGSGAASPSTVNVVAAVPSASAAGGSGVAPSTVNAVTAIPAVSPTGGGSVAASTVNAVTAIPTPTVEELVDVSPATVNVAVSVSTPTVSGGGTVSPSAVTALAAVPSVSVSGGGAVTAVTVNVVAAVPGGVVGAGSSVAPSTVAAIAGVPAVTLAASSTVTVTPVAASVTVPSPTLAGGGSVTVTPVQVTVSIGTPFVSLQLFGPFDAVVLDDGTTTFVVLDSGQSTAPAVAADDTFLFVLDDGRSTAEAP